MNFGTFTSISGSVTTAAVTTALTNHRRRSRRSAFRGRRRTTSGATITKYCFTAKKRPSAYGTNFGARQPRNTISANSRTTNGSVQASSKTKNTRGVNKKTAAAAEATGPGREYAINPPDRVIAASCEYRKSPASNCPGIARKRLSGGYGNPN